MPLCKLISMQDGRLITCGEEHTISVNNVIGRNRTKNQRRSKSSVLLTSFYGFCVALIRGYT